MKFGLRQWWSYQRRTAAPVVEADLTGKTVLVLGASTGLGLEAAVHFAKLGAGRLILACRSEGKGQAAVAKVNAATQFQNKLELWLVDLVDFASVKRFADKWDQDGGRLDILVANAALGTMTFTETKDGFESSLQVANLSTPLVVLRLLPSMLKTAEQYGSIGRIVVVASDAHYWANIDKEVWEGDAGIISTLGSAEYHRKKGRSAMLDRYSVTKLLNVFFARALAARIPVSPNGPPPIVVNSVNPGMCRTEIFRELPGPISLLVSGIQSVVAYSAEEGSRQYVYAAVGEPEHPERLHGEFIMGGAPAEPSDFVVDANGKKLERQLWDEVVEILGKADGKVDEIVQSYLGNTFAS
ncbi:Retinol dehydrogenase 12 [Mycena chlorophos]|uniref:Retinol dehydrogenase 12 n=1 Tax=Mycena chlorophos TaxID=658473 RepID=A0A8H6SHZ3_MYCCL|nr:Retinol dehydrogenase 12 [Mycena chlorophos]